MAKKYTIEELAKKTNISTRVVAEYAKALNLPYTTSGVRNTKRMFDKEAIEILINHKKQIMAGKGLKISQTKRMQKKLKAEMGVLIDRQIEKYKRRIKLITYAKVAITCVAIVVATIVIINAVI